MSHPTLSVKDAMLIAKFTDDEVENKCLQRKVLRRLPGKGKRNMIGLGKECAEEGSIIQSIDVENEKDSDLSPITDDSARSLLNSDGSQKKKSRRLTVTQKQEQRVQDYAEWSKYKEAHKAATTLYSEQLSIEGGMSLRDVEKKIKTEFKVGPSKETIRRHVVDLNNIGISPTKRGPEGDIPPQVYKSLCMAFATKTRICQLNSKVSTRKKQVRWIMKTLNYTRKEASRMWERLSRDTAVDMTAGKMRHAEERRVKWTTYSNLELWFDGWEKCLDDLGFFEGATSGGERLIPEHQLRNIVNFDETCLSLDGSTLKRGGRPAACRGDARLPQVGMTTSKASQTVTMITGSNAYGEALPPHFQFMTTAKTTEGMRVPNECYLYSKKVVGAFGLEEEKLWPATFGVNEKGGMDNNEFVLYLRTNIMPLYPNAAPKKGKWVILKCDSGPGRMNIDLLAELRASGFILFPGVPNTTAVSQETDQNYGPFKNQYAKNLDALVEARVNQGKTTSLPPWMVCLIVYGGTDPETNFVVETSAFQSAFSREACRSVWAKVGAAPLTKKCLGDKLVRKSIGDVDDEYEQLITLIQEGNNLATDSLVGWGYDASALKDVIVPIQKTKLVTEENTMERQLLLMNASTAGKKFTVMGGNHLTSDDILIAAERSLRDKEKGRLLALKKKCTRAAEIENKGKLVIETKGTDCNGWLVHELEAVLAWYGVQKMSSMGKQQKIEKWREIQSKNGQPVTIERWTDELEQQLITASKTDIAIGDTAVGRYEQRKMEDFKLAAPKFTNEQWAIMNAEREQHTTNQGLGGDP